MIEKPQKSVVLLSGGPDSSTLAFWAMQRFEVICALHFNYGQVNAAKEGASAKKIARQLGISLEVVNIRGLARTFERAGANMSNGGIKITMGQEEVHRHLPFIWGWGYSIAATYCLLRGVNAFAVAITRTDDLQFSRNAIDSLENTIHVTTGQQFSVLTPFIDMPKGDVFKTGAQLGVPFAQTWSCLQAFEHQCGRCHACKRRKEGFIAAGLEDPTKYKS